MMRRVLAIGAVAALTACGGAERVDPSPPAAATETAASSSPAPTPAGPYIAMEDDDFVPPTLSVEAGDELALANVGENPHTFTMSDFGIDVRLSPGETGTVTIDLPRGEHAFVCSYHDVSGMDGRLTVT